MEANENRFSGKMKDLSDAELHDVIGEMFKWVAEINYRSVIENGFYIDLEDITLAINWFIMVEDYEKCAQLQSVIDSRYKRNLQ